MKRIGAALLVAAGGVLLAWLMVALMVFVFYLFSIAASGTGIVQALAGSLLAIILIAGLILVFGKES